MSADGQNWEKGAVDVFYINFDNKLYHLRLNELENVNYEKC